MNLINKGFVCLLLSVFLLPVAVKSQVVNEAHVKLGKKEASGFIALSSYGRPEISEILKSQFGDEGLKKHGRKHKFTVYKGVVWHVTGAGRVDLYYKVTGNKKRSKVYFIASKGYDNYITSANDQSDASSIIVCLGGLDAAVTLNVEKMNKEAELNALGKKLEAEKTDVKKT